MNDSTEITDIVISFLSSAPALGWLALLALTVVTYLQYRSSNPPLPPVLRGVLIGLRVIALAALFLTILEPVVAYEKTGERKPRLALAVDVSGSITAEQDGRSRLTVIDSALSSDQWLAALEDFDYETYYIAESLLTERPTSADLAEMQGGTALGDALADLSALEFPAAADAWLLLSDGINNLGRATTDVSGDLKVPLTTIGVGDVADGFDIELADIDYNPVAYVGSAAPIKAKVRWHGATGATGATGSEALIELYEHRASDGTSGARGSSPLDTKRIKLGAGSLSADLELEYTPNSAGGKFLELRIIGPGVERRTENNSQLFSLKALKSRLKALLVSESLNWDYRFIKSALSDNDRIEVTEVIEKVSGKYLDRAFPTTTAQLSEYDLIILHNPSGVRRDGRYESIGIAVESGAGLLALIGDRYDYRPPGSNMRAARGIDELLPVSAPEPRAPLISRSAQFTPVEANILHPALRINQPGEDLRQAWAKFPPLEELAPLTAPKDGALVLADAGFDMPSLAGGGLSRPALIATQKLQRGKVALINGAPLWRMAFQSIDTEGATARFNALINGAVNWLSVTEDVSPLEVRPERDVFARGEEVGFSASALDAGYQPLENVTGEVALYSEDGKDTIVTSLTPQGNGLFRAAFDGVSPGGYRFEGRIDVAGSAVKTDSGRIEISQYSLEQRQMAPDFAALQTLSLAAGGSYTHISEAANLSEILPSSSIQLAEHIELPLRGHWIFLALFISCLGAEWLLRKRNQLL